MLPPVPATHKCQPGPARVNAPGWDLPRGAPAFRYRPGGSPRSPKGTVTCQAGVGREG
jgi:hypothetical protein